MYECLGGMYMHRVYECCYHWRAEENDDPETAAIDGCETLCGYWEVNLGPLKERVL